MVFKKPKILDNIFKSHNKSFLVIKEFYKRLTPAMKSIAPVSENLKPDIKGNY
jgi:hypothetical protein